MSRRTASEDAVAPSPREGRAGRGLGRWVRKRGNDSLEKPVSLTLPTNLTVVVWDTASSPQPSPSGEEREKTLADWRFGGSKREWFRGILSPLLRRGKRELPPPAVEGLTTCATLDRRDFIKTALAATAFAALQTEAPSAVKSGLPSDKLIDVNVTLGQWPLRRVRYDDAAALVAMLRARGVEQAWAGSFEGLLHKDLASVNSRLAEECRRHGRGLLVPFGTINPKSPGWEEDMRRCAEEHRMAGIRLHPNYHGYKLDDPDFARLLRLAAERRLPVELALMMEDERMMHPLLRVEPVETAPLASLVGQTPGLRLVLLNALGKLRGQPLRNLLAAGAVYVEISMLEGVGGIENVLEHVPLNRLLFGSHAPLFYFESARLKLKESRLSAEQLLAIGHGNAQDLLAKNQ